MEETILDDNNRELQKQRRRQRERQKSNRFRLAKQQLGTCITLICTFLSRRCTICGVDEHSTQIFFFSF